MTVQAAGDVGCVKKSKKDSWNQKAAALRVRVHWRFLSKGVKCIPIIRKKGASIMAPLRPKRGQSDMKNLRKLSLDFMELGRGKA